MATQNENRIMQPVGERPLFSIVKGTAVSADATAGTYTLEVQLPIGASIKAFVPDTRSSTGQEIPLIVTLSGNTFTIADGAVSVVNTGDVTQIFVAYDYR